MFTTALTLTDKTLDIMIRAEQKYVGLYDRCAMLIVTLLGLANLLYPYFNGSVHLAIPSDTFLLTTWLIVLPFLSIFMFVEAGHWDGIAQLVRIVLGVLFLTAFALMVVMIINGLYVSSQVTPPPAPVPLPTQGQAPSTYIA